MPRINHLKISQSQPKKFSPEKPQLQKVMAQSQLRKIWWQIEVKLRVASQTQGTNQTRDKETSKGILWEILSKSSKIKPLTLKEKKRET